MSFDSVFCGTATIFFRQSATLHFATPVTHVTPYNVFAVLFPGTYRLVDGNYCAKYGITSGESKLLQDDDMATCESLQGPTNATFGIFFKKPWHRSVVVTIYGYALNCSPVDGIDLTVVSDSSARYGCKAYKMENEGVCQYNCPCSINGQCNRVAVILAYIGITSGTSRVCEVEISHLLQWSLQRNIMWTVHIATSGLFN